jgi:hypothetical protein
MPLGSGFGLGGAFGEDPFGQTNFARKILLENLPSVYVEADLEERNKGFSFDIVPGFPKFGKSGPFEAFIRGLFPNTNEFRVLLDRFPLIRNPELMPKDEVTTLVLLENLQSVVQVVEETLPVIVPGNLITLVGDDPAETITVTVIAVDNALSRIQIGTLWPFDTSVRTARIRNEVFRFLVTNGSDFIVAVPDAFPNLRVGDFVDVGDGIRRSVIRVNEDLFQFEIIPTPPIAPSPQRREIVRLSRLVLLTLLAKDIGLRDDATKLEDVRRGLVLHAVEFYKLKGTKKGYRIRGALEGLDVKVFNFQELPCVSTTCHFIPIAVGTIVVVDGDEIPDGKTVTISDVANGAKVFEFDKDGSVAPGNVAVPITNAMTADVVAKVFADAINDVSPFNVTAESDGSFVNVRNDVEGLSGVIAITETMPVTGFTITGMTPFNGVACLPEKKTLEQIPYLSEFDVVPTDTVPMDSPSFLKYFDLGTPATGTITAIPGAMIADGETFILNDGENPPVIFEFDKNGNVTPGRIGVVIDDTMTDEQVALVIEQAINSVFMGLRITATHPAGTPTVNLRNDTPGIAFSVVALTNEELSAAGNQPIVESVADPAFFVSGMSGGVDGVFPATGRIEAIPGNRLQSGETFILNDGVNPVPTIFEFTKTGSFLPNHVPVRINDEMTSNDVAQSILKAVNGVGDSLKITATFATRDIPIRETVVNSGFMVSGMSGSVLGETEFFPITFPDVNVNFNIVGASFKYNPGPGADQITLVENADLLVGDVVDFGLQQRIVTVVSGASPFPEVPGFRIPGTVITFDAVLVGLSPGGTARRVTRLPDINPNGDFLTVAGFDYKVVQYTNATFSGSVDTVVRDVALVGHVVVATRSRRRVITRRQAFDFCRLPVLKLHMKAVPSSLFFSGGFESVLKFIDALDEVRPLHVRFEDIQFEQEILIQVPIPKVTLTSELTSESLIPVDNYMDSLPMDETSFDSTKVVTVETP